MKVIFGFFLVLFSLSLKANEVCQEILSQGSEVQSIDTKYNLLRQGRLEINKQSISISHLELVPGVRGSLLFHATSKETREPEKMGQLNYKLNRSGESIEIVNIDFELPYQQKGLGALSFQFLLESFPEVRIIKGFMAKSNALEFKKYFAEFKKHNSSQEALSLALQKTPFYKSLASIGIKNLIIKDCYYDPFESNSAEQIQISVSK